MLLLSRLVLLSMALLFLNACSSLSKSECEQGDWRTIGLEDAAKGARAETKLSQHVKACSKHEISLDQKIYAEGYADGLKLFCTRKKGFSFGSYGYRYLDTCPDSLEPTFISAYVSGLDLAIHKLDDNIEELRFESLKRDRRLLSLERQHIKYKDKDKSKSSERIRLYKKDLHSLRKRISSLRSDRNDLVTLRHKWSHPHPHTHSHSH